MGIFALDLRADPDDRDRLTPRPLLNLKAETSANTQTPRAIANDEAADDRARCRLQMVLDCGIDPAHDLTVENRREGDPVGGTRYLVNSFAKIVRRARITELATQLAATPASSTVSRRIESRERSLSLDALMSVLLRV